MSERASGISEGLSSSDARERELAFAGVYRLSLEDVEFSRGRFPLEDIVAHFDDEDADAAKSALLAFTALSTDDRSAEATIVGHARSRSGSLQDWQYIRYLRHDGISSDVAVDWLFSLAEGPMGDTKLSATRALVAGMVEPPQSLLPIVMDLVRSPEYFCHSGLTQHIPKFGAEARQHLDELRALRVTLLNRVGTGDGKRPDGSTLGESDVRLLDNAIVSLQRSERMVNPVR
jgi:hypothetical protein